ncbi:MAG: hypothetical protein COA79_26440 [Planctomycetota bacterium]|nr:MAG: hypothetical protein COA79_26440 [Planctomycetota bacterium]
MKLNKTFIVFAVVIVCMYGNGDAWSQSTKKMKLSPRNLIRFSVDNSKTASLNLSAEATAFIDLFLDFKRNHYALKQARVRGGVPHHELKGSSKLLHYKVGYVNMELASLKVPMQEVPKIAQVVLKEIFLKAVQLKPASALLPIWRYELLSCLALHCDSQLLKDQKTKKTWNIVRSEILSAILKGIDSVPEKYRYKICKTLTILGDNKLADAVIKKIESCEQTDPLRYTLVRAIAGMSGEKVNAFVYNTLKEGNADAVLATLWGIQNSPSQKVLNLVANILNRKRKLGSFISMKFKDANSLAQSNALSVIERIKTVEARKLLEKIFEQDNNNKFKYNMACALLSMGSSVSLTYLKKLSAKLPDGDGQKRYINNLIKKHDSPTK